MTDRKGPQGVEAGAEAPQHGGGSPRAPGADAGDGVQASGAGGGSAAESEPHAAARPQTLDQAVELIEALRAELAARQAELDRARDHLLRERAELENFKRRMQREKAEALRFANEGLVRELLPVVDNLELAVKAAGKAESAEGPLGGLLTGVEMVLKQFSDALERCGVSRIEARGTPFDPSAHEAVAQVESEHAPEGAVVEEHRPGYRLHDRLLRAAQVTVAKSPGEGKKGDAAG